MVCRIVLPLPLLTDRCSACSYPAAGCLHPPLNGRYRLPSIPHPVVSEKGWPSLDKTCFEASSFNLFVTADIFSRMLAVHFVLDFYAELTQAWPGAKIMLCQSEGSKHTLKRLNWTLFRWTRQNTMQIWADFASVSTALAGWIIWPANLRHIFSLSLRQLQNMSKIKCRFVFKKEKKKHSLWTYCMFLHVLFINLFIFEDQILIVI